MGSVFCGFMYNIISSYPQNLGIGIISVYGILVSFFLKYFGSIWNILAVGCGLLGFIPFNYFRHGVQLTNIAQVMSVCIVAFGVFLFSFAKYKKSSQISIQK